MVYGNRFPLEFNPWRIPKKKDGGQRLLQMSIHQLAANPHRVEDEDYLQKSFIVGGPWNAIPDTRALVSTELNLKRCGLCQWVYGRTVRCHPCGHLVCTVCLGLTALVTVDRMICLFCWTVPQHVHLSWEHQNGEMRLHLQGPEVVTKISLAAHYHSR